MKVFVTGNTGFIGKALCRELAKQGNNVIGYDTQNDSRSSTSVEQHIGDLHEFEKVNNLIMSTRPDVLIHLAARTDIDESAPIDAYSSNIDCVENLCSAIQSTESIRRSIFTSSQLVCKVGYTPKSDTDYAPNTVYGKSKVLTEKIIREKMSSNHLWTIVRPTTVWGPEMSTHYQGFIRAIEKGYYFHVGKKHQRKSYSYIGNIVDQYIAAMNAQPNEIAHKTFYFADKDPLSLREYANHIAEQLGSRKIPSLPYPMAKALALVGDSLNAIGLREFPFNSFRLNNILSEYVFDTKQTQDLCPIQKYDLKDGVQELIKWYKNQNNSK